MVSQQFRIYFLIVRLCLFLFTNSLLALPAHANGLSSTISNYLNQPNELQSIETNLQLWLDSNNINGNNNIGLISGQAIDSWTDLSGNNNHATQLNTDNMPIFNNNTVLFDGNDKGLTLATNMITNKTYTIIAVEKRTNINKANYFIGQVKNSTVHFD